MLLIPATCDHAWLDGAEFRIVVPLDGSALAEAVLEPARELATTLGAELLLLRVVERLPLRVRAHAPHVAREQIREELQESRRHLRRVAGRLRSTGVRVATRAIVGAGPAVGIAAVARERVADLIALATHGRGGLARLAMRSVATDTIQLAKLPILVMRPAAMRHPAAESSELDAQPALAER